MAVQGAKKASRGRENPVAGPSFRATEPQEPRKSRRERSDVVVADSRTPDQEIVHEGAISFLMLANPVGAARVVDLRAGDDPRKRTLILREALKLRATKVFALVESTEAAQWEALGFREEGTIPGYFGRPDGRRRSVRGDQEHAVLLGSPVRHPAVPPEPRVVVMSEGRAIELPPEPSASQDRADRAAKVALRELRELPLSSLPAVTVHEMDEADARRSYALAARAGTALTAFAPLVRRGTRSYFVALGRADFAVVASLEARDAYGNAFLELLESPTTMEGVLLTMVAVDELVERARSAGAFTVFAFSPSDDEGLAMAFLHAGFQRTGLLSDQFRIGTAAKDAILWVCRR